MSFGRVSLPWTRFLRFSVRGLLVVVLVIGAGLGWLVRSARIQREAVEAIKNAGGSVCYNWEYSDGNVISGGNPWAPPWWVNLVGVDYFGHVSLVVSPSARVSAATIELVGPLSQLEELRLGHSAVADAGLGHLNGLGKLKRLILTGTDVNDTALVHLKGLRELSALDLIGTGVTDAGLAHLKGLSNLSVLGLSYTKVSDRGLEHLSGLKNLSSLDLHGTQVTDAGMVHLKGLSHLSYLNLLFTQVTDAGIKELKQALPSLTLER